MNLINYIKRIHFIGVGGVSMSALAKLMLAKGAKVSGSDVAYGKALVELTELGADVWCGASPTKITGCDLVVYSSAIQPNNAELAFAELGHIPTMERMDFLAEVSKGYDRVVAVAGTHGKTTVTSMLADIFIAADMRFTAHIGGFPVGGGNLICNGEDVFLTEACEYKRSFLKLTPDFGAVTNVEADHPDTYKTKQDVFSAFDSFAKSCASGVILPGFGEYKDVHKCTNKHMLTYGNSESNSFGFADVHMNKSGSFSFLAYEFGIPYSEINLNVVGMHNVYNALLAYGTARALGINKDICTKALQGFKGVSRRFERKGYANGALVISDYAHHPEELAATIASARNVKGENGKLILVFQPHTYSRTQAYFEDFVHALSLADIVYIYKEYPARETPERGKSANDLYVELNKVKDESYYFDSIIPLAKEIKSGARLGDIIVIAGAGDVAVLADIII